MFRFAIVGCGRIAPRHADSLRQIEGAKLVAVVDINSEKAKKFADKYEVKVFSSIEDLNTWGGYDIACICTPSGMHPENSIAVMNAGKHVVVEKPMALRLEDADQMIATAKTKGVQLFVVKQNRFNLPVQAARKAFLEGRFGKLNLGTVRVRWCRTDEYYKQASWRGTWALDGGVFSNQASHHIDLLEWFMGEVDTVFAKTSTQLANIECEDTGVVLLKFKSGALGVIEATTATRPVDLEGSLSLLGENGSVEISGFAVNKIRHFNFVPRHADDAEVISKYSDVPPNVYGFGHLSYLQNVVSTLQGKCAPEVDGAVGKKSLQLIHAIYVSAETGKEVRFAEERKSLHLGKTS